MGLIILLPLLTCFIATPLYIKYFKRSQRITYNFEGKEVVNSGGGILLVSLIPLIPFYYYFPVFKTPYILLMFYYLGVITLLGFIDDLYGETECKGFKGHLGKFMRGEGVSTGLSKALGGLIAALLIAYYLSDYWYVWLLKGVFMALFSNIFNLLDTRPGRAIKIYLVLSFIFAAAFSEFVLMVSPIWAAIYMYLFWELRSEVMLGDAGAYLLGGSLGFYAAAAFPLKVILAIFILLLYFHWYCERKSLNRIIESNYWLYYLDRLGRKS